MTKKTTKTDSQKEDDSYALRRLNKPDFVAMGMKNETLNRVPGVIPHDDRLALIKALPDRMDEAMKAPFVDAVLFDAETCLLLRPNQSGQSYVLQLREIEGKARALLQAMARTHPDAAGNFALHGRALRESLDAPEKGLVSDFSRVLFGPSFGTLPYGGELGFIWDVVQDVENIAHIAAGHLHPQKGKRPGEFLSKAIAYGAAQHYKDTFSTAPPLTEMGWFAVWLSDLGGKLGHPFSAKQAATALRRWHRERVSPS
jgi:hypothetical protein